VTADAESLPPETEPSLSHPLDSFAGMGDVAIEADGLQRTFGGKLAVAGVDLAVQEGEIYGFLGPNGAGKSTTVRMLCTLLGLSGGRASVAGFDVAEQPEQVRLRIGVALQDAALDPKQSGRELLRLQARLYGLHRHQIDQRVEELTSMVDIGTALDDRIGTYSGGMKRRLDLAAALVHNPQVLFLDEPTTGLDPVSRTRVWEEVRMLNSELGVTIFLTTQYLEEADVLADRVGIIVKGQIAAEGQPDELKRRIGTDVIIVRVAAEPDRARAVVEALPGVGTVDVHHDELTISVDEGSALVSSVAVALNHADVTVHDLTLRSPSLDDVFLELTGDRFKADTDDDPDDDEPAEPDPADRPESEPAVREEIEP
jgi:ABC-2 type transport system ATP-binding protein